jgi:hypothetical protein
MDKDTLKAIDKLAKEGISVGLDQQIGDPYWDGWIEGLANLRGHIRNMIAVTQEGGEDGEILDLERFTKLLDDIKREIESACCPENCAWSIDEIERLISEFENGNC